MELSGRADTIYLHCLPALHDLETDFARANPDVREVDDDVFESPASRVFDQAENRMHTIKALMVLTLGREGA
jgi:ornithine carbamoyltransferase